MSSQPRVAPGAKIVPHLWYDKEAVEAASFYVSLSGPLDPFNHAVSFIVNCDDQAEVDRLWEALTAGGAPEQCGWLRDRYGLSWQIVPTVLGEGSWCSLGA